MQRKVEKFSIAKPKPHPKQDQFFRRPTDEAVRRLADDMERHGQREPIIVLPDGTIICGHIRHAAAKLLGWKEIDAVVRHDLVGQDDDVERLLISDNAIRRQLSKLEQVRCTMRLFELEGGTQSTKIHQRADARKRVGEQMGLSEKQIGRFLAVLVTPPEVQLAYDADVISLVDAVRVSKLSATIRSQIAAHIKKQGLDKAKAIINEHLPERTSTPQGATQVYQRLRQALVVAHRELGGRVSEISLVDGSANDHLVDLRHGQSLIGQLIAAEERALGSRANGGEADGTTIESTGQLCSGIRGAGVRNKARSKPQHEQNPTPKRRAQVVAQRSVLR